MTNTFTGLVEDSIENHEDKNTILPYIKFTLVVSATESYYCVINRPTPDHIRAVKDAQNKNNTIIFKFKETPRVKSNDSANEVKELYRDNEII